MKRIPGKTGLLALALFGAAFTAGCSSFQSSSSEYVKPGELSVDVSDLPDPAEPSKRDTANIRNITNQLGGGRREESPERLLLQADSYFDQKRWHDSARLYKKYLATPAASMVAPDLLAVIHYRVGFVAAKKTFYAEARDEFAKSVQIAPFNNDYVFAYAKACYDAGDYFIAEQQLATLIGRAPSYPEAQYYYGLALLEGAERASAIQPLTTARGTLQAYALLVDKYYAVGDLPSATSWENQMIQIAAQAGQPIPNLPHKNKLMASAQNELYAQNAAVNIVAADPNQPAAQPAEHHPAPVDATLNLPPVATNSDPVPATPAPAFDMATAAPANNVPGPAPLLAMAPAEPASTVVPQPEPQTAPLPLAEPAAVATPATEPKPEVHFAQIGPALPAPQPAELPPAPGTVAPVEPAPVQTPAPVAQYATVAPGVPQPAPAQTVAPAPVMTLAPAQAPAPQGFQTSEPAAFPAPFPAQLPVQESEPAPAVETQTYDDIEDFDDDWDDSAFATSGSAESSAPVATAETTPAPVMTAQIPAPQPEGFANSYAAPQYDPEQQFAPQIAPEQQQIHVAQPEGFANSYAAPQVMPQTQFAPAMQAQPQVMPQTQFAPVQQQSPAASPAPQGFDPQYSVPQTYGVPFSHNDAAKSDGRVLSEREAFAALERCEEFARMTEPAAKSGPVLCAGEVLAVKNLADENSAGYLPERARIRHEQNRIRQMSGEVLAVGKPQELRSAQEPVEETEAVEEDDYSLVTQGEILEEENRPQTEQPVFVSAANLTDAETASSNVALETTAKRHIRMTASLGASNPGFFVVQTGANAERQRDFAVFRPGSIAGDEEVEQNLPDEVAVRISARSERTRRLPVQEPAPEPEELALPRMTPEAAFAMLDAFEALEDKEIEFFKASIAPVACQPLAELASASGKPAESADDEEEDEDDWDDSAFASSGTSAAPAQTVAAAKPATTSAPAPAGGGFGDYQAPVLSNAFLAPGAPAPVAPTPVAAAPAAIPAAVPAPAPAYVAQNYAQRVPVATQVNTPTPVVQNPMQYQAPSAIPQQTPMTPQTAAPQYRTNIAPGMTATPVRQRKTAEEKLAEARRAGADVVEISPDQYRQAVARGLSQSGQVR